jgi:hypothetical protein
LGCWDRSGSSRVRGCVSTLRRSCGQQRLTSKRAGNIKCTVSDGQVSKAKFVQSSSCTRWQTNILAACLGSLIRVGSPSANERSASLSAPDIECGSSII